MHIIKNYAKHATIFYDVYHDGKKVKKKTDLPSSNSLELVLKEQNLFLGKLWWLGIFLIAFLGLFGGIGESFDDQRTYNKTVRLNLNGVQGDEIKIHVDETGSVERVDGVDSFTAEEKEEFCPQVKKRRKAYKICLFSFLGSILLAIALAIIISQSC